MTEHFFGIDLGTTHCTVAKCDATQGTGTESGVTVLPIPQYVAPGEIASLDKLPSFVYVPTPDEGDFSIFDETPRDVVGTYAQRRSSEVPRRVISSSKSWLSHAGVDRRKSILPSQAPEDIIQRSPIEVGTMLLRHLKLAVESHCGEGALKDNHIVVTVPASFDAIALSLTEEAVQKVDFGAPVTLLEEPQAALYSWLSDHEHDWHEELEVGESVLVVDIGGGTTDFSLIEAVDEDGALGLRRVAVGDHILLGGDNMDLALAHRLKARMQESGQNIDERQFAALVHGCRQSKELLFADQNRDEAIVVIPSKGRKLVGGTLRVPLKRTDVGEIVVGAFFPAAELEDEVQGQGLGLQSLGLPYARDAAITRHLAAFLRRTLDKSGMPDVVMFNGGVTKADGVRDRVIRQLNYWRKARGNEEPIRVLEGSDPDLAVARGAAYYAFAKEKGGVRIQSGTVRSYYVGIERNELAIPGVPPAVDAVCIAPMGMNAGDKAVLDDRLGLLIGQPASFRFFSSQARPEDEVGARLPAGPPLDELPPVQTTLSASDDVKSRAVPITLQAELTELGTLELFCQQADADRRWRLTFDVRGHEG